MQILPATGQSESRVLQIAAALEAYSEHPIGQAIMQAAQRQQLELPPVTSVKAEIGQGISGEIQGKLVLVGKAAFLEEQEISLRAGLEELNVESSNRQQDLSSLKDESLRTYALQLELEGKTVVWVAYAKEVLGIIAIADTPRPSAAATIKRLKQLGIEQIVLLSGDNQRTADIVLLLITNFTGNITMPLGVIGHEGSTVIVTLSGLRLLKD